MTRVFALCLIAVAVLLVGGCNKQERITLGETEGPYVTVDDIKYQIQISRILNPAAPDDAAYLRGLPEDAEIAGNEVWYGIFLRAQNDRDKTQPTARRFVIKDTQGAEYEPIELDPEINDFVYEPAELAPGKLLPPLDTPASDNTIRGGLLLFKVTADSLGFRPLEFEIESPSGGDNAVIDIDV